MTLALFLVPELGAGPRIELTGAEAHHAATVKRVEVGERVLLTDGHGGLAEARAVTVGRDRLTFEVLSRVEHPEPDPRFVVVQALPKGDRAELAVEVLTELGVDEIIPWAASRSISQWRGADKVEKGRAKWQRTALEAAKQSRRARIPVIAPLASTDDVLDRVRAATAAEGAAFVLHEGAHKALGGRPLPLQGELLLIVGPEGGVSPEELDRFTQAGASPSRLGEAVLRTSTAGAAALAVLSVATGRWADAHSDAGTDADADADADIVPL
jgi:16S rRNA (uracil1498-N3)-methyltransferase